MTAMTSLALARALVDDDSGEAIDRKLLRATLDSIEGDLMAVRTLATRAMMVLELVRQDPEAAAPFVQQGLEVWASVPDLHADVDPLPATPPGMPDAA